MSPALEQTAPPLRADDLGWGYPGRPLGSRLALRLERGQAVALLGPNGAGKSTLLRTLAGVLPPLGGQLLLGGKDVARMSGRERARQAALLTQELQEDEGLLVRELVEIGRTPHLGRWGTRRAEDRDAVDRAVELCGLRGLEQRPLGQLSGGERQRARIAMAVAQQAPLLLLDEPTTHLDLCRRYQLFEQLRRLRKEGAALLMVLHEISDAFRQADRVLVLDGERADEVSADSPETVGRLARAFAVPESQVRW
jgi:iron complex transport system ATP-binding protein